MKRFVLPILLAAALPAANSRIIPAMNAFTTASYKQLTRREPDPLPLQHRRCALHEPPVTAGNSGDFPYLSIPIVPDIVTFPAAGAHRPDDADGSTMECGPACRQDSLRPTTRGKRLHPAPVSVRGTYQDTSRT
jgi:hypothetical protein